MTAELKAFRPKRTDWLIAAVLFASIGTAFIGRAETGTPTATEVSKPVNVSPLPAAVQPPSEAVHVSRPRGMRLFKLEDSKPAKPKARAKRWRKRATR